MFRRKRLNKLQRHRRFIFSSVFILISATFSFLFFIQKKNLSYIERYIIIRDYNFIKTEPHKNSGLITITIRNSGRKILNRLPVKIYYYSEENRLIGSDKCDILKRSRYRLKANQVKTFELYVSYPEETHYIEVKI